jgi:hypothetical protein
MDGPERLIGLNPYGRAVTEYAIIARYRFKLIHGRPPNFLPWEFPKLEELLTKNNVPGFQPVDSELAAAPTLYSTVTDSIPTISLAATLPSDTAVVVGVEIGDNGTEADGIIEFSVENGN